MKGEQVLKTLRQGRKGAEVGVIVVSAFATPGEMYGYRKQGADACLSKPFLFDELLVAIKGVLEAHPTEK
jgi:DNA-binding response OmpR family regulator